MMFRDKSLIADRVLVLFSGSLTAAHGDCVPPNPSLKEIKEAGIDYQPKERNEK